MIPFNVFESKCEKPSIFCVRLLSYLLLTILYCFFVFQGIKFTTERLYVNTIKSHLVTEYTLKNYGPEKQHELVEILLQKYFEEGLDINSYKVLLDITESVNIDKSALTYATSADNIKRLIYDVNATQRKGIRGVPYYEIFVEGINDTKPYVISGAQADAAFLSIFNKLFEDGN